MNKSDQRSVRCALVRGGTSKGLLISGDEIPTDHHDEALLSVFGSYEPRQVDGVGGGTSTTSKLMIVSPSPRPDADIEYTFGQVGVDEPLIDYGGNCGNMTTAVGPFAYDEDLITAQPNKDGQVTATLYNTNTDTRIKQTFSADHDRALTKGEFSIHGVPGTGACVDTTFFDPNGSKTGSLFPLGGPTVFLDTSFGEIEATVADVTTPVAIVRASDIGLTGAELPPDVDTDQELLDQLEELRAEACVRLGIVENISEARSESPGFPKLAFVSKPQDYETANGSVTKEEIDITARIMSMQTLHPIYAVTGAACTAATALLPGTIPNEVAREREGQITLGHPQGTLTVEADVISDTVRSVTISRTQRRLMEGRAFYSLNNSN